MAAEARFNRVMLSNEGWRILAENGDLTELRVRAWNSEALTEAEQLRVDAAAIRPNAGRDRDMLDQTL